MQNFSTVEYRIKRKPSMPSRDRMEDKLPLITPISKNRKFFPSPVKHCKQLVLLENKIWYEKNNFVLTYTSGLRIVVRKAIQVQLYNLSKFQLFKLFKLSLLLRFSRNSSQCSYERIITLLEYKKVLCSLEVLNRIYLPVVQTLRTIIIVLTF